MGGAVVDDRGIDDRAGGNLQPVLGQMPPDLFEQPAAEIILFEQVAEAAHPRLVRRRLAPKVDPDKIPHRRGIVERLFHRRVRRLNQCCRKWMRIRSTPIVGRPLCCVP
jgi:hypothetical protein